MKDLPDGVDHLHALGLELAPASAPPARDQRSFFRKLLPATRQ